MYMHILCPTRRGRKNKLKIHVIDVAAAVKPDQERICNKYSLRVLTYNSKCCELKNPSDKGKRLIITHIDNANGFVNGALWAFEYKEL